MGQPEQIEVVIRSDFMERQTRAEPVLALAELIWNSVDADATSVPVDFAFDTSQAGCRRSSFPTTGMVCRAPKLGQCSVVSVDRGSALRAAPRPSGV